MDARRNISGAASPLTRKSQRERQREIEQKVIVNTEL